MYWQHLWAWFKSIEISFEGHPWKRLRHCAFAAFGIDPHLSDDDFRQIERYVCLLYKPANRVRVTTSGGPDLQSSAKKGSNWDQHRVHWYLKQEWPVTMSWFKTKSTMPCSNIPLATDFSWIKKTARYIQSTALFHLPLKLFWLFASVDVPRDAGTRFAAARNRAYLVQINVTVETIATIKTILSRILIYRYVWSKLKIYIGQILTWSSRSCFKKHYN